MPRRPALPMFAATGLTIALLASAPLNSALAQACTPAFASNFQLPGVNGDISASIMYDAQDGNGPRLYVGGQFSRAGGRVCNGVAMWDGTKFVPLGGGVPSSNLVTSGSGNVRAMAVVDPDGAGPLKPELWVGGTFTRAQQPSGTRITVNGIARWNGSTQLWSSVPRDTGETDVFAFLTDEQSTGPNPGPRVYVATNSDASATAYLMAYVPSGSTFSRIDFGSTDGVAIDGIVSTLVKHNGQVYFGGAFADGVRRITVDGTNHEPLPAQPAMSFRNFPVTQANANVGSMISYQGRLLITPQDTAPAGSAINMVPPESFNGTTWQPETFGPLGSTVFSAIGSTAIIDLGTGPKLVFGGSRDNAFNTANFQTPAGLPPAFNGGAVWDGTTLSPLAGGIAGRFLEAGNAVTFTQTTLRGQPVVFVGGILEFGNNASGVRVQGRGGLFWNGASWTPQYPAPVNGGYTGTYTAKLDGDKERIVGDSFGQNALDTANPNGIPQYDGVRWSGSAIPSATATGFGLAASYLRYDDGTGEALFAVGNTFDAPDPQFTRVAKFGSATQTWNYITDSASFPGRSTPGIPMLGNIVHTVFDTDGSGPERPWLIIAGNAQPANDPGFPTGDGPNIYAYTGSQWVALGNGLPDTGTAFGNDSRVTALAIYDDGTGPKLYASGTFTGTAGGDVARYDGTGSTGTWTIIGKTTAPFPNFTKIRVVDVGSGPALHAFGAFTDIFTTSPNANPTGPIARWTGTNWVSLNAGTLTRNGTGGPLFPLIADIAAFNDGSGTALYATGPFRDIGGTTARGLGRYNGTTWSPVGLGFNSFNDNLRVQPRSLVVFDDDASGPTPPALYISGFFDNADGTHSENFARYGCPRIVCRADFDGNNLIQVPDIFAFLAAWFANNPSADFDGNNLVQVPDIFAFLAAWFAGC